MIMKVRRRITAWNTSLCQLVLSSSKINRPLIYYFWISSIIYRLHSPRRRMKQVTQAASMTLNLQMMVLFAWVSLFCIGWILALKKEKKEKLITKQNNNNKNRCIWVLVLHLKWGIYFSFSENTTERSELFHSQPTTEVMSGLNSHTQRLWEDFFFFFNPSQIKVWFTVHNTQYLR